MIGVYKITNTVNGKVYIGSASVSFEKRWLGHVSALNAGTHHNKGLQKDWNRLGKNCFCFEVVETVDSTGDVLRAEQRWLDEYFAGNCYNTNPNVTGGVPNTNARRLIAQALESGLDTTRQIMAFLKQNGENVSKTSFQNILSELGYGSTRTKAWIPPHR